MNLIMYFNESQVNVIIDLHFRDNLGYENVTDRVIQCICILFKNGFWNFVING